MAFPSAKMFVKPCNYLFVYLFIFRADGLNGLSLPWDGLTYSLRAADALKENKVIGIPLPCWDCFGSLLSHLAKRDSPRTTRYIKTCSTLRLSGIVVAGVLSIRSKRKESEGHLPAVWWDFWVLQNPALATASDDVEMWRAVGEKVHLNRNNYRIVLLSF